MLHADDRRDHRDDELVDGLLVNPGAAASVRGWKVCAAALIFEIVWFHRAGLVFGNDLWSTSLVLSTYMGGLALGNGLVVAYGHRIRKLLRMYAFIEATGAFTGLAVPDALPPLRPVLV